MLLRIIDYSVYYNTLGGDVQAADKISLDVQKGEIVGIAGESGCGKSTLCNSLILLKPPMKHIGGKVFLDEEVMPVENYEAMKKFRFDKISIIPQYAMDAMNPTRKIGPMIQDILAFRNKSYSSMLSVIKERLEMVELPERVLGMYPIELSGGMKQRMVMVLSTLANPQVLLCDEITSALDVSTQKAVVKMTMQFRDREIVKGIVFVTHDMSVLYQMADSIVVMYAGKVVERASAENIFKHPSHPYTKLLIHSLPEIGIRYETEKLTGIAGKPPSLLNPPKGCRFKDRCNEAFEKCNEEPTLKKCSPDNLVACWRREG